MLDFILNHKKAVLWVFGLITLAFLPFAAQVKPDNSVEAQGVINDPALESMYRLEKIFGSEEFTSISFATSDILDAKTLTLIENLSTEIENIPQINKVLSLTRIPLLQEETNAQNESQMTVTRFIRKEWIQNGVPIEQRQNVLQHPFFARLLYNQDGKSASILAQFSPLGKDDVARDRILSSIELILKKYADSDVQFHVFGMPVINRVIYSAVEKEQVLTTVLMLSLVAAVFFVIYRRIAFVILPLVLLSIVMIWILGLIQLLGSHFSWMLAIAPAVVIIVSVCNSVHVINAYVEKTHLEKRDRVVFILKYMGLPCFMTTLTDLVGFFSISSSRIIPIRDFGLYVGLGSVFALIVTVFLLPIFLTWTKDIPLKDKNQNYDKWAKGILLKVLAWDIKHSRQILLGAVVVLILSMIGISKIVVDQHVLSLFKWGNEKLFDAGEFVRNNVGAGTEFYFSFESHEKDYFIRPDILRRIDHIQTIMSQNESHVVVKSIGLADLVKSTNRAMHADNPAFYAIPDTQAEIAQLLFLASSSGEENLVPMFVNDDYSHLRLRVFTTAENSARNTVAAINSLDKAVRNELLPEINFSMSGRPLIMCNTMDYIIQSAIVSFSSAVAVIFIALVIFFRSFKLGLISMAPNVLPILATMGLMGFLGIELDVATCLVASTVIGVAVDDTIHFVWHIKREILAGASYERALEQSFREAGFSAFSATLVICCGFMGLVFSQIWPTTYFGILTALSCFLAMVTEIFVTPALLLIFRPIKMPAPSHVSSPDETLILTA